MPKKSPKVAEVKKEDSAGIFPSSPSLFSDVAIEETAMDIARLGYDPHFITEKIIDFGLLLTGISIYGYQYMAIYRIIYSIVAFEGETITLLWARQSGKSESLAFVVDTLAVLLPSLAKVLPDLKQFEDGIKIGLFAPQAEQVNTTYTRALSRIHKESALEIMADPEIDTTLKYDARLVLTNGSSLTGQVASKTSKIESKTYHLIFIEEAQDVDSNLIEKSIEPMITATLGTIVKVGTTGTIKNDFFHEIMRNIARSRVVTDERLKFHFQFDWKEVIFWKNKKYEETKDRFHLNYGIIIKKIIEKRGEHSDSFKLSYALIWALESGMFITDRDWNFIINKKLGFTYVVPDDWDVRAGLDIGKDNASTVMTVIRLMPGADEYAPLRKQVLALIELENGMSYEDQHHMILDALIDYNVTAIACDYTGVGKPVVDRLIAACGDYVEIVPYAFSRQSKSDMWVDLTEDIRNRRLIIPANKAARETEEYKSLEKQLKGMVKYHEGGYLVAHKGTECPYDDYCDSLALAIQAAKVTITPTFEVEVSDDNPFMRTGSSMLSTISKLSWRR